MNEKLLRLKAERTEALSEMKRVNEATVFDADTYERTESNVETLSSAIKREEKIISLTAEQERVIEVPAVITGEIVPSKTDDIDTKRADEIKAFESYMRSPIANMDSKVRAVLNTLVGAEGGYLVPETYLSTIISKLTDVSVMRQNCTVVRTKSTTNIPLGDGRPTFGIIAENGQYPETDASFKQAILKAFKLGGIIKASDELIRDAFTNIQTYITNLSVEGIAEAEEVLFTVGTGVSEAQGIVTGSDLGFTTAGTDSLTADEVKKFIYSVKAGYRRNAKIMMNSQTELALSLLKDTNGQYLWQQSLTEDAPNRFMNYPIIINEAMASLGTGNKFMTFGDMSYYHIGDRGQMEIMRMGEKYAEYGQVGFRVSKSADGKLLITEAVKHMANA